MADDPFKPVSWDSGSSSGNDVFSPSSSSSKNDVFSPSSSPSIYDTPQSNSSFFSPEPRKSSSIWDTPKDSGSSVFSPPSNSSPSIWDAPKINNPFSAPVLHRSTSWGESNSFNTSRSFWSTDDYGKSPFSSGFRNFGESQINNLGEKRQRQWGGQSDNWAFGISNKKKSWFS